MAFTDRATLEKHNNLMQFNCTFGEFTFVWFHYCRLFNYSVAQENCVAPVAFRERRLRSSSCCNVFSQNNTFKSFRLFWQVVRLIHLHAVFSLPRLVKSPSSFLTLNSLGPNFTVHRGPYISKKSLSTRKWTPEQRIQGEADLHSLAVLLLLTLVKGALLD